MMKTLMAAHKSNNILIVDDTPQNLHLLVDILSEYDYKVRPVPNGKLALSAAEISPPDLILLDIMMPGLDGYQVCKQLKSNPKTKDIPVIFISAVSESIDKVKAFSFGAADYITKPFQMHEVLMRVKNQLAISNLQQQLKAKNARLDRTLEQLKLRQKTVLRSQKYLALEKISSGLNQRIDPLLAEVNHSLAEIGHFGRASLKDLPNFLANISPQQQKYLTALLQQSHNNRVNPLLSAEARQKLKNRLIERLDQFQLEDAEQVAEMLIELGADEELETFLPLLASDNYWEILDHAHLLLNLHQNAEHIAQYTSQIKKATAGFQEYTSSHNYALPKRQANVKSTIEQALSSIAPHLPSGIQIIKHYSNVSTIYCHPEALQKMWFHIIQNAVEAIGTHGILTINIYQKQNNLLVDIIDTGESINPEILGKLCAPFFTTKTSAENMGLGLAIAKQIVEQHNGKITVALLSGDRTLPGNTKFTVSLPLTNLKDRDNN